MRIAFLMEELYFKAKGFVQGVGYRYYAAMLSQRFAVSGFCRNAGSDEFECVVQGSRRQLEDFLSEIKKGTPSATILETKFEFKKAEHPYEGFEIY